MLSQASAVRRTSCSDGVALELLDNGGEFVHVIIVYVRDFVEPRGGGLGGDGEHLTAELLVHSDGAVVVIVLDSRLRVVEGTADHILGHVHPRRVRVTRLDRVLPIPPYPRSRVSEHHLLESPLPGINRASINLGIRLKETIYQIDDELITWNDFELNRSSRAH